MKHRIWINFIVVLALALGSGEIMPGEDPAAHAAPTEVRSHAPPGERVASEQARSAFGLEGVGVDYIGHIGGQVSTVVVVGQYAYVGEGPSLTILDVSAPNAPAVVGRSDVFASNVMGVAVSGDYAYVSAGYDGGLRVIDVSDPSSPSEVGFYDTPGCARDVAISGIYAYVADDSAGLRVIDVSDPAHPIEVGDTPGFGSGVAVQGSYAYVAGGGLQIINVSDPAHPTEVSFYNIFYYAVDVALAGDYAFVADDYAGLQVINVSDPANPSWVGLYDTPGFARGVALAGSYAYVADSDSGLRVIDVSDPANPTETGFYTTPSVAQAVAIGGDYAYVADAISGLRIINVSDPYVPIETGFYTTPAYARSVALAENYAYIADNLQGSLHIIDISDPAAPDEAGFSTTPGLAWGVAIAGDYAYVADGSSGLRIIDVSDPAVPTETGYYITPGDAWGVAIAGDFAYVMDVLYGLRIIDVSDPASPSEVGHYYTSGYGYDVVVVGDYAYVAAGFGGLYIIDVSDPYAPVEIGLYYVPDDARGVAISGNYAYLAGLFYGLWVIDVSDPENPSEVGFYETLGNAQAVSVKGSYAFVADGFRGLRIIDVSDPSAPAEISFYDTPGTASRVALAGDYAYVADGEGGLIILESTGLKAETDTVITSDTPDPSQIGEPISVDFQVTASSGTPTGVITVTVTGEAVSCLGTLTGGAGECEITLDDPGIYTLTASYSGDAHFLPSSTTEQHTVVKADSAVTILSDEPDPSQVGEPIVVAFEATGSSGTPSGSVTVTVAGEAESCTDTLSGGTGDCEITLDDPGTYTLAASYSGDAHFLSSSTTEQHTVAKADSAITILSDQPDPSQVGEPISVTFEVMTDHGIPTGSVTVTVAGETESCTGTLTGGAGGCEITLSDAGTYTLTAAYSGDGHFLPSSAVEQHNVVDEQTVKNDTTTTILSDEPDPSQVGEPISVTFEVTGSSGTPSGEVTVTVAGESVSCTGALAGGTGGCQITLDDPGTYTLAASYSGDDDFLPSSTTEEHKVVEQPSVAMLRLFLPLVIRK
jgi:hypothetical protein